MMVASRLIAVILLAGSVWAAQGEPPAVRIEAPTVRDAISGTILITIGVGTQADAVSRVTVSVDGVLACTLTAPPFQCRYNVGIDVRQRVIRAVATFRSGERAVDTIATRDTSASLFKSGTEAVLVNVSVRDYRNRFVTGLTKDQFRVYDNGVPQELTFFAPEGWACEVVLAIDISASMQKSLAGVRRAATAFLSALRPGDNVTVTAFNSSLFVIAPPKASPEARLRAIERLAPWDGTALFDAILGSLDLLESHDRRRAIVVFTDGEDNTSASALQRVERRLAADDVLLYVVGHGSASELPALRDSLERVAQATGGRALFLTSIDKATDAFRTIVNELSEQYTIGFTPDSAAVGTAYRPLRVDVAGGGYRVRARQGYALHAAGG
jgi:Ca-activated chloride channel homolog